MVGVVVRMGREGKYDSFTESGVVGRGGNFNAGLGPVGTRCHRSSLGLGAVWVQIRGRFAVWGFRDGVCMVLAGYTCALTNLARESIWSKISI